MSRSRLLPTSVLLVAALSVSGCGFQDTPTTATPPVVGSPAPAAGEPQDACTQIALSTLDGLLNGMPSGTPQDTVQANDVVAEFVVRYDQVITASGVPAARAQYAQEVGAACAARAAGPASVPPANEPPPVLEVPLDPASPAG